MKKILIIKMGYSETLDSDKSKIVSLGDVVRCSVILESIKNRYPNSQITWLVSKEAFALVEGNKHISKILVWDEFVPFVLMREQYDMVINLEKIDGICALVEMINAWEKVGFRFDSQTGSFDTYSQSLIAKEYIQSKDDGGKKSIWQEIILNMLGSSWSGQEYSLGYEPKSLEMYDVGLNWQVGVKWPTKGASKQWWEGLCVNLQRQDMTCSWQQGEKDLYEYMEWINSCRVTVTNDSLGLHLALALKKNVIALFGATDSAEIYLYGRGVAIEASALAECKPCYKNRCDKPTHCMELIDSKEIASLVKQLLKGDN